MTKKMFPNNPFARQPIKQRTLLAGRDEEVKKVEYYLKLTAGGQSPHLALIGERGIGKTSLLNVSCSIARDLDLIPIRIDLNEEKTKSAGNFWFSVYCTMINEVVKLGCWGGESGPIYTALFQMLYIGGATDIDKAVLKFPVLLSSYKDNKSNLVCDDSLIIDDLLKILEVIKAKNKKGLVFFIDEADCFSNNKHLLQVLRNIFQRVGTCSLFLCGTRTVFDSLSEVFSPIPRQFHKMEVKPFLRSYYTSELINNSLTPEFSELQPTTRTVMDLHELCGGNPAELQLYCHHMYRDVENGQTKRMELHPQIFKAVMKEYRESGSEELEKLIKIIDKLPGDMFTKSYLKRHELELVENIEVEVFGKELENGKVFNDEQKEKIKTEMVGTYQELFNLGILNNSNQSLLKGGAFTQGYWKSFVKVEKSKRWVWENSKFREALEKKLILFFIDDKSHFRYRSINVDNAGPDVKCLMDLRQGIIPEKIEPTDVFDIMNATIEGRKSGIGAVVDVDVEVRNNESVKKYRFRYLADNQNGVVENFDKKFKSIEEINLNRNISLKVVKVSSWTLPTNDEVHKLAMGSQVHVSEKDFGVSKILQALRLYEKKDLKGAVEIFKEMLIYNKKSPQANNNLAFCLILDNQLAEAKKHLNIALEYSNKPLVIHNMAILESLQGNRERAENLLENALAEINQNVEDADNSTIAMLIFNDDCKSVKDVMSLPLDAGVLLNLNKLGKVTKEELEKILSTKYPTDYKKWIN